MQDSLPQQAYASQQGVGVIIELSGVLATNFHIVKFAQKIYVHLKGKALQVKIIELWPQNDLALLKTSAPYPFKAIALADSHQLKRGDEIMNIGTIVVSKKLTCRWAYQRAWLFTLR
mgnify:CR=1 FL=1